MQALAPELTTAEAIVQLSARKYRWKTNGQLAELAELFDDELVFVHLNGHISSKHEWLEELRTRRFIYHEITVRQAAATLHGPTAVLVGQAAFKVSWGGAKGTYQLVYTEVYTQKQGRWKLVNIHTCTR